MPLNYSEPHGRQAAIALIRKPAIVPERSPFYRGPVLFNPGGPGGSGVDLILSVGHAFATVLGPQFDVVGFDPRGIARSTPRADFFNSNAERAMSERLVKRVVEPNEQANAWAQAQVIGSLAASHDDGYLAHINTPNTATDMLSIARAHGRDKIQYWGFSYGTVLGATFASMYPDNVERLVIDGVMDSKDYYSTTWLTNLEDTNKGLDRFFESCAEAGAHLCPLHSVDPEDIRKNLTALYINLKNQPVPVKTSDKYGVVDYAMARMATLASLYSPYTAFAPLAKALHDLINGDGSSFFSLFGPAPFSCSCDPDEGQFSEVPDGFLALHCNDGDDVPFSPDELRQHYESMSNVSDWAETWVFTRISCLGWPKVKKGFRGPFGGNTSHPLLVVGNTADPVTPLSSAKKMAEGFAGAVVLTQDTGGHCSINSPSICTQNYIREYFQSGTLPEADTVCQPIIKNPFFGLGRRGEDQGQATLEDEDAELWDAAFELARNFKTSTFGL